MAEVKSRSGIDRDAVAALAEALKGQLVTPEDPGYDGARQVWNRMIDRRPAVIAQCAGVADVIDALAFARTHGLTVAVRGGGHNVAGNAVCDDALVIDLSGLNQVRVDPEARRVQASGGATIGDVDRETLKFGLAVPLGAVSSTGIGGLTLYGGHSHLARKYGFACDALVSVDLVTADGRLLTASEARNADLFWALRGAGGNFGIVTSFEYEAYPVPAEVALSAPFYPVEAGAQLLASWRDHVADAPEEYTGNFMLWSVPAHPMFPEAMHGREVAILAGVHVGRPEDAARFIQPIRSFSEPLFDLSGPIPYTDVQQMFDPFFRAKGERFNYWKSIYLDELTDEAIGIIVRRARERPSPWTILSVRNMGGAMARVEADATALGTRSAPFLLSIDTGWTDPAITEEAIAWTRSFHQEMQPFSRSGGAYLNFDAPAPEDGSDRLLRASYGDAGYERLRTLKAKYDPENVFRLHHNIAPAEGR